MMLRAGEDMGFAGLLQRGAGLNIFAAENFVSVEAHACAHATGLFTAITQGKAKGIIRHAGLNPDGALKLLPFSVISTMSPLATPSSFAVLRLTSTALSQVILVMGSGSSCNQPLFA